MFTNWVSLGFCSFVTPATIPGQKVVVPSDEFYPCLEEWFQTDLGRNFKSDVVFMEVLTEGSGSLIEQKIRGWRQYVTPIKIDDVYSDGPKYLNDINNIENRFGIK